MRNKVSVKYKSLKFLCFVIFCFICCIITVLSVTQAGINTESGWVSSRNSPPVELREWSQYTDKEKDILRNRWSEITRKLVIEGLIKGDYLPNWVPQLDPIIHPQDDRGDDLRGIDLRFLEDSLYINFSGLKLQGALLNDINLQGSNLSAANLQGADLSGCNLKGADLFNTKLQWADLSKTILQEVDMRSAELRGANLREANLLNANLFGIYFDFTYLWMVNLGEAKNIRYINWGDRFKSRYITGDEIHADSTKSDEDFFNAEITYRDLKNLYKKEYMDEVAKEFHFRENEVLTKRYLRTIKDPWDYFLGLLRYIFLRETFGYGSRPTWLFWYSLVVIVLFSVIYVLFTIFPKTKSGIYFVKTGAWNDKEEILTFRKGYLFVDCFYFSLLSFVTFGYGALQPRQWLQFFRLESVEYKPVRWARIFVGIEAALGIWIFALLVTVLFERG